MTDLSRTFDVAPDENLVDLISRARRRLLVICPAVTEAVGNALAARLDGGFEGATIILDADPEVYRLGYGTEAGFDLMITSASRKRLPWGRFVSDMSDVSVEERGCS